MKIGDLIQNPEFYFNAEFRIYRYEPIEDKQHRLIDVKLTEVGNSESGYPDWVKEKEISAINQDEDGVLEIEFVEELC